VDHRLRPDLPRHLLDWSWDTANEADNIFRPLATAYDGETIVLADQGLRAKDTPPQNIKC
jgi:hypothetical protein